MNAVSFSLMQQCPRTNTFYVLALYVTLSLLFCSSLRKHIDFETVIKRNLEEPVCITDFHSALELDMLPGVRNKKHLHYHPETVLKEVLQKLGGGGDKQPVEVIGTRIAQALRKVSSHLRRLDGCDHIQTIFIFFQ